MAQDQWHIGGRAFAHNGNTEAVPHGVIENLIDAADAQDNIRATRQLTDEAMTVAKTRVFREMQFRGRPAPQGCRLRGRRVELWSSLVWLHPAGRARCHRQNARSLSACAQGGKLHRLRRHLAANRASRSSGAQMRAKETCAAGNQNPLSHTLHLLVLGYDLGPP
jgi:hypothetical protein